MAAQIAATDNADELYRQALEALEAGQPQLAQAALERVVAARPRFAGAWLDLALATQRAGDRVVAIEHLEYLRSQFALPADIRAIVDAWQRQWQASSLDMHATPRWQGEIFAGIGHDSNINAGLATRQIPLDLGGGSSIFLVAPEYRPRPSAFGLFALALRGKEREFDLGRLTPLLVARSKQAAADSAYDTLDLQAAAVFQPTAPGYRDWQYGLLAQHYRLGGQPLFNALRLNAQRNFAGLGCQSSLGAEVEYRRHERITDLGGVLTSANAGLVCPLAAGGQLGGLFKYGHETPAGDRPGGANRYQDLALYYQYRLSATQQLQANWQYSRLGDAAGYSPLLENNAPRRLARRGGSIVLRQALDQDWELRLSYEQQNQTSNLPLFEQKGQLLMVGLAWRFAR